MAYKILPQIEADEVPDWKRREPKWSELVDAVLALTPGKTLPVLFDDIKVAKMARNAVRDMANMRAKRIVVRTRLEKQDNGTAKLFLTRLHEDGLAHTEQD
jgi:hypothetical protein